MKILVVEDDAETARFYKTALEMEGYEVDVADSSAGALEKDFSDYGVVLLDINLGDRTDGFTVLSAIRQQSLALPVCMVTCSLDPNDVSQSFRGGADAYLVKPFEVEDLLARVQELSRRGY